MSIYDDNPTSPSTDDCGLEPLMDVHELAAYLSIPISTVYDWRVHGKGPTPPAGLFHDPASSPEMTPTSSPEYLRS